MESVGARLKKIRLEKGYSLEDAHKKTKIHINILKALEEDSLMDFNPIYIKGFLKIYCNFLEVNPKDFISDYKDKEQFASKTVVSHSKEKKDVTQTVSAKQASVQVSVFNTAFAALSGVFSLILSKIKIIVIGIVFILMVIAVFKLGGCIVSKFKSTPKKTKVSRVSIPPKASKKIQAPQKIESNPLENPLPSVAATRPSLPKITAASTISLGIKAKDNCWVQVKADGKIVFQGVLKKSRSEHYQAKERIELSLGNAGLVELEVNNKNIASLGRKGQVLKNILITRNGLSTAR